MAIGVLVLMFSLAGQVFSLTIRSTGQATALTTVTQTLRAFENTVREDLSHVESGQSFIWIQANPVNAYWTQAGKEADDDAGKPDAGPATGYPHASDPNREYGPEDTKRAGHLVLPRADLLMFVTARPGVSYVDPGIAANTQLVVYGHAIPAEFEVSTTGAAAYTVGTTPTPFPVKPARASIEYASPAAVSPVPAEQWQLARRSVLLVPTPVPASTLASVTDVLPPQQVLFGLTDVIGEFEFEREVLTPWRDSVSGQPASAFHPPAAFWNAAGLLPDATMPDIAARSALDVTPPAPLARTFGQYMLPHCASFKVEWALDPRSDLVAGRLEGVKQMIWIDQGDLRDAATPASADPLRELRAACLAAPTGSALRRNLHSLLSNNDSTVNCQSNGHASPLALRFGGKAAEPETPFVAPDDRPNIAYFGARRLDMDHWIDSNGDGTPDTPETVADDVFPAALRITVDVFDSERRLDRPIRHVMVIPIGG